MPVALQESEARIVAPCTGEERWARLPRSTWAVRDMGVVWLMP
jgi:hypothetical protein